MITSFSKFLNESLSSVQLYYMGWNQMMNSNYKMSPEIKYFERYKSDKASKYHFVLGIKDDTIVSYYAKLEGIDKYEKGYIESSIAGIGYLLIEEMKKHIRFISFVRICNIQSLKSHFKAKPTIIHISENETNSSIWDLEKIFYENLHHEKIALIKNQKINNDLISFIVQNNNIKLCHDEKIVDIKDIGIDTPGIGNIKIWMLF